MWKFVLHAGLTLGEDGATHQFWRHWFNENVTWNDRNQYCDYNQTKAATLALADHHGPDLRFDVQ
jgi:transketolase